MKRKEPPGPLQAAPPGPRRAEIAASCRLRERGLELMRAVRPSQIAAVRSLFQEYAEALGVDLCFQNFSEELARLPGEYAPPDGALLLARFHRKAAGCVALRKLRGGQCEMKRLYVRPEFRGNRIGLALVEAILAEARLLGYRSMCLDTLRSLRPALALYQSMGFKETRAYYRNPLPGVIYLKLILEPAARGAS